MVDVRGWTFVGVQVVLLLALILAPTATAWPMPGWLRAISLVLLIAGLVRHPIYTGVLAIVVGIVIGGRSWLTLGLGVLTVVFFNLKARWEEQRLAEAFPGYAAYAARTPRFVPFAPVRR